MYVKTNFSVFLSVVAQYSSDGVGAVQQNRLQISELNKHNFTPMIN